MKHSSTLAAATDCIEDMLRSIDGGKLTISLYIDCSKAFNSANDQILTSKLERIGLREICNALVSSYLQGRQQYVPKKHGFPILNIMGYRKRLSFKPATLQPLVSDFRVLQLSGHYYPYADDTVILYRGNTQPDIQIGIDNDLLNIEKCTHSNQLFINTSKQL